MTKDLVKRAFSEAQDSLKEKKVDEVKKIVIKTLEKIESLQGKRKDLDEQIRILKMDIDDLKEGRLDRIEERQSKDEKAKDTSVVIIIKEKETIRECSPWYWPWRVIWPQPQTPTWTIAGSYTSGDAQAYTTYYSTIDCSSAKWGTAGTYCLSSGETINLR